MRFNPVKTLVHLTIKLHKIFKRLFSLWLYPSFTSLWMNFGWRFLTTLIQFIEIDLHWLTYSFLESSAVQRCGLDFDWVSATPRFFCSHSVVGVLRIIVVIASHMISHDRNSLVNRDVHGWHVDCKLPRSWGCITLKIISPPLPWLVWGVSWPVVFGCCQMWRCASNIPTFISSVQMKMFQFVQLQLCKPKMYWHLLFRDQRFSPGNFKQATLCLVFFKLYCHEL